MPIIYVLVLIANWSAGAGGYNTPRSHSDDHQRSAYQA